MITVICGEDTVTSRTYFTSLLYDYRKKNYEVKKIEPEEIFEINKWMADSSSLFAQKNIFVVEYLNKKVRRDNKKLKDELEKIDKMKDIQLIDWEDVSAREIKAGMGGKIKEFKPAKNIFKLTEAVYPGNKKTFLMLLGQLSDGANDQFIFLMLSRHIRSLILTKEGLSSSRIKQWQIYKLNSQAKHWSLDKLLDFYEGLLRIDISLKTGRSPYSVKESLDILACYYL